MEHESDNHPYLEDVSTPAPRKALWIEIRDSSTGERRIEVYATPIPKNRGDRERLLNRHVPAIYPGAKMRTYAGGAGTFIRDMLLITAHFAAVADDVELLPVEEGATEPVASSVGQGSLFAA